MPRPEFRVFIGKLLKTATEEEVQALVVQTTAEITLCSDAGWTYQFAIAFFHETSVAEAAVQTTQMARWWMRRAFLRASSARRSKLPNQSSCRTYPSRPTKRCCKTSSTTTTRDFGKRTEAWGFAVLRFSEANAALAATNDINGLSMGESVLQVRAPRAGWLS